MGISQIPPVPTPTAKGEIIVGTATGPTKITASTTANFSLLTDSTTATGLKYGQTGKVWGSVFDNFPLTPSGNVGRPSTAIRYDAGYYWFGTSAGCIVYSTDAKNWTASNIFGTTNSVEAIAANTAGTAFVAVGAANKCFSATSIPGTWTSRTSGLSGTVTIADVIWVGGSINLFILCGEPSATSNVISTSPDGATWTGRLSLANTIGSLTVNTANNVIIASVVTTNIGYYSTNGTTWTSIANALATTHYNFSYFPHLDRWQDYNSGASFTSANYNVAWTAGTRVGSFRTDLVNIYSSGYGRGTLGRPLWDATNNRYYALTTTPNGPSNMLLQTFSNASVQKTGGGYFDLVRTDISPVPLMGSSIGSTTHTYSNLPALGFGNGIWVVAMADPGQNSHPVIVSTAP